MEAEVTTEGAEGLQEELGGGMGGWGGGGVGMGGWRRGIWMERQKEGCDGDGDGVGGWGMGGVESCACMELCVPRPRVAIE